MTHTDESFIIKPVTLIKLCYDASQVEMHIKPDFHSFFCGNLCPFSPASKPLTNNDIKFSQNIEFCHGKINKWQLVSGGLEKDFPTHWWASLTAGGHRWVYHDKSMASFTPRSTSHTVSAFSHTESLQQWLQTPVQTNYSVDLSDASGLDLQPKRHKQRIWLDWMTVLKSTIREEIVIELANFCSYKLTI